MSEPFWTPLGGGVVDYEGAYNPATQYAPGDVVRYLGVDYLCVNPALGLTPPNVATPVAIPAPTNPIDAATYAAAVSLASPLTDEFRSGPTLDAKWLALGTAFTTADVNATALDCLYLTPPSNTAQLAIRYQPLPAFPFTAAVKIPLASSAATNNRLGGIILVPASPTTASPCLYCGVVQQAGGPNACVIRYSSLSAFAANEYLVATGVPSYLPFWVRVALASATSVTMDWSLDGYRWIRGMTNYTSPFSIANVGLAMSSESGGVPLSLIDYFRVIP